MQGEVSEQEGCIDAPIGRDPKHGNKMAVTSIGGREAKTCFQVRQCFEMFTLLLVILYTGRTHQIRVHLRFIGFPIVGDKVYGSASASKNPVIVIERQALHSHFLQFRHPVSLELLSFTSPLPVDFQRQLQLLKSI